MQHMRIVSTPLVPKVSKDYMHLVLPHLFDKVPHYLELYRQLSVQGAFIMMDNSIFELKEAVTGDMILECGRKVLATELVIPEVLRNPEESKKVAKEFLHSLTEEDKLQFRFAAVTQGSSYEEVVEHYKWLCDQEDIRTICIPFNFEFDAFGTRDETRRQKGWNRFSIIYRMVQEGVWNESKRHHLLGLYNPAELAQYNKFVLTDAIASSIRSNDSSSIFWHSLHGVEYDLGFGLPYKKITTEVDFHQGYDLKSQYESFDKNSEIMGAYIKGHEGYLLTKRYLQYFAEAAGTQAPMLMPSAKTFLNIN